MPFGLLMDLWECHKQFMGIAKPKQVLTIDDVSHIYEFGDYSTLPLATSSDKIFGREPNRKEGVINSDILKIGKIKAKESDINIYNLHLQVSPF